MNILSRSGRTCSVVRRLSRGIAISIAALLLRAATVHAETLLVLPASGQNVSAGLVHQARMLLIQRLFVRCTGCWILDHDGPPAMAPIDPVAAVDLGRLMRADVTVTLNVAHGLSADPRQTVLTVVAYAFGPSRIPIGYPVRVQRATTEGPDSLQMLVDEMALFLLAGGVQTTDPSRQLGPSVIGAPGANANPRKWFFGGYVASSVLFGTPAGVPVWFHRLGGLGMYLGPSAMFELRADTGSASLLRSVQSWGLGAYARQGTHWFVGGIAQWVWQQMDGRGANGLAIQPTVALVYPIDRWPTVRADLGYAVSLFQERGVDRLIVGAGGPHRSHGPTLSLGVVF